MCLKLYHQNTRNTQEKNYLRSHFPIQNETAPRSIATKPIPAIAPAKDISSLKPKTAGIKAYNPQRNTTIPPKRKIPPKIVFTVFIFSYSYFLILQLRVRPALCLEAYRATCNHSQTSLLLYQE